MTDNAPTIADLLQRSLARKPLGYGNFAIVYPMADEDAYVIRIPHNLRKSFESYILGHTPLTPFDRFYDSDLEIKANVGQPLITLLQNDYEKHTGVTINLRCPGHSLDTLKSEGGKTSWRLMEMFMQFAADDQWKSAYDHLVGHYNRIRMAKFDVDSNGNNIIADIENGKLRFVDILSDQKSSLADAFCNIVTGSAAIRLDDVFLTRPLPKNTFKNLDAYQANCRRVLDWMLGAAEERHIPFVLQASELHDATSIFRYVLETHCGYASKDKEAIYQRIEDTLQYYPAFQKITAFEKTQHHIGCKEIKPALGFHSDQAALKSYLATKKENLR